MSRARIASRIEAEGPMPFEEFMEIALYDPDGGFFTAGPLRSARSGDFLTSPEVSPWFGRMLGRFVLRVAPAGSSARPIVVDAGAGSGSLLESLLPELPDGAYDIHAVDVSSAARAALAEKVPRARLHASMADLPERFSGVVIANELLDNLPVALAVRTADGWTERWVDVGGDAFTLVVVPARPEVVTWCDANAGVVPEGGLVEVELAAESWLEDVLARLDTGALVVIDYGGTKEELEPRRSTGTLRTYRAHHLGPDPLLEPGTTDITVDVNFSAMAAAVAAAGAAVEVVRQDDFLRSLGLADEIARIEAEERALVGGGDGMQRLLARSERVDASTLLHPRGLGDFRVLIARTPGDREPGEPPKRRTTERP